MVLRDVLRYIVLSICKPFNLILYIYELVKFNDTKDTIQLIENNKICFYKKCFAFLYPIEKFNEFFKNKYN